MIEYRLFHVAVKEMLPVIIISNGIIITVYILIRS